MKFFVPLVCCLAFVRALPGGQSVSSRSQDDWGNYESSYDIVDEHGAKNGRQEKGDAHGNKVGSYWIQDIDGRSRKVEYVADAHGFRATIGTNEPGTASSHVGDATYLSSAPIITESKQLLTAHAVAAPLYAAAPVAYSAPLLRAQSAPWGLGHGAQLLAAPAQWGHGAPLVKSWGAAPLALSGHGLPLGLSHAGPALLSSHWK